MIIAAYTGNHLTFSQPPTSSDALGILPDAIECTVQRDTDGLFEFDLTYPANGANANLLVQNNWLYLPVGGSMGKQFFRISQVSYTIGEMLTVHGCHVSYNAATILAAPFESRLSNNFTDTNYYQWYSDITAAINKIDSAQMGGYSLSGYTDDFTMNAANYTEPVTLKQALQDAVKDIEGIYLCYLDFGMRIWNVPTATSAPQFQIRYGRDMLDYSYSVDATDFYTHIMPYYMVDGKMVSHGMDIYPLENLPTEFSNYRKIKAINLADYYTSLDYELDQSFVQSVIDRWLNEHPWNPFPDEVSVDSVPQEGNEFELGNIGRLFYTPTHTVITAHIVSLTYDAIADRVTSIGINKRQKDVTDTIASLVNR